MSETTRPVKRLIWDIETSPNVVLSWRTGYKINIDHDNIVRERAIICICYKWEGKGKVEHVEWNNGCDKEMLRKFVEVASEADELVAHNGDKFDIKWINTRIIANGLEPIPIWKTIDTLKIAKRHFNFNSNRLDYLGKFLLGHGKLHTEFGMWKAITLDNCPIAMGKMVKYAKRDVELLESVWQALAPYHTPPTHAGVHDGDEKWTCPWTGSQNVTRHRRKTTARGTAQHEMVSLETGGHYIISDSAYTLYAKHKAEQADAEREAKAKEIIAKVIKRKRAR